MSFETDTIQIIPVAEVSHLNQVKALFAEYVESLPFALTFQDFEAEMAEFPGRYGLPEGCILAAIDSNAEAANAVIGCVALKKLASGVCEMKRLFIRPAYRGLALGRHLSVALIEQARQLGYERMRLDTIETMKAAVQLYYSLGFTEIEPYYDNPVPGALFMECQL